MILVTGATGLSGSIVVREFARQDVPIRALVRNPDKAGKFHGLPGVEVVEGDMLRPGTLTAALRGVERVLMISSPRERMVETQCTFVDAAKAAGVPHIVKYSGKESGIGFDPGSFIGTREHLEIERHLEASGLAWTHLRPSQFMEAYLPGALTGVDPHRRELRMSIGDSRLAPVAIADVAKVAVAVLSSGGHEGRAYDMTGPEALTMKEVVERSRRRREPPSTTWSCLCRTSCASAQRRGCPHRPSGSCASCSPSAGGVQSPMCGWRPTVRSECGPRPSPSSPAATRTHSSMRTSLEE